MKQDLGRAAVLGMAAGVVATVIMDVFVALAMVLMGSPVTFMFSFIGDVVAACAAFFSVQIAGGVAWGAMVHYLFGLCLGGVFAVLRRAPRFNIDTVRRSTLAGILFIEVTSQPFLALAPLVLPMSAADTLGWYGLSTVMHAIYGSVLGFLLHSRAMILARPPKFGPS
jgi:hypothetical protein